MIQADKEMSYPDYIEYIFNEKKKLNDRKIMTFNFISTSDGNQIELTNSGICALEKLSLKIWIDFDLEKIIDKEQFKLHVFNKFSDIYVSGSFTENKRRDAALLISLIMP